MKFGPVYHSGIAAGGLRFEPPPHPTQNPLLTQNRNNENGGQAIANDDRLVSGFFPSHTYFEIIILMHNLSFDDFQYPPPLPGPTSPQTFSYYATGFRQKCLKAVDTIGNYPK